jgi:hypothetical protein
VTEAAPKLKAGQTRVTVGEKSWVLDEKELDLRDAFAIKAASGLRIKELFDGIAEGDPSALQALVWFVRMKDGDHLPIADVNFRLADLDLEQGEDEPESSAPDPTTESASTP